MAFVTFKYMKDNTTISYDTIDNINLVINHPLMFNYLSNFQWDKYIIHNISIDKHVIIDSKIKFIIFNMNCIDRNTYKTFIINVVLNS